MTLLKLIAAIRARHFNLLISLAAPRGYFRSLRDLLFFKICGIPKIIGIPFHKQDLYPFKLLEMGTYEPEYLRIARRVESLTKVDTKNPKMWDLLFTQIEIKESEAILNKENIKAPFICFSVGSKFEEKDWGIANWKIVISGVALAFPNLTLVGLGAQEEYEKTQEVFVDVRRKAVNICGFCSPRTSGLILKKSLLYIGHDSGPMHLAATVGTPCVAIFSLRNNPGQWYPRGESNLIFYPNTTIRNRAIDTIKPNEVLEQIIRKIKDLL